MLLTAVGNILAKDRNEPQILSVVDLDNDEELYTNPDGPLDEDEVEDLQGKGSMDVETWGAKGKKQHRTRNRTLSVSYERPLLTNVPLPEFDKIEGPMTCSICWQVLKQARATRCCLTRMCLTCINNLLKEVKRDAQHPCPHCRKQITSLRSTPPDRRVDNLITVFMRNKNEHEVHEQGEEEDANEIIRKGREFHKARMKMIEEASRKTTKALSKGGTSLGGSREGIKRGRKRGPKQDQMSVPAAPPVPAFPPGAEEEMAVHLKLMPVIEVANSAWEVRTYKDHVECSTVILPKLADGTSPTVCLANMPQRDGNHFKKRADISEWRQHISQVTAGAALPCPYVTASSHMSLEDLRRYLTTKKLSMDEAFARNCVVKGVSMSAVLGNPPSGEEDGAAAAAAQTSEICGASYASSFVFDYEFYLLLDNVPMRLDYGLRLVDVARSLWVATGPLEVLFRSIGKLQPAST